MALLDCLFRIVYTFLSGMGYTYQISVKSFNRAGESVDRWEEVNIPVKSEFNGV